jgi:hypothetical protein
MRICKKHQSSHYSFETCPWCVVAEQDIEALRVEAQIREAVSILDNGTAYEKAHVIAILRDALRGERE